MLGAVVQVGRREWEAQWTDAEGHKAPSGCAPRHRPCTTWRDTRPAGFAIMIFVARMPRGSSTTTLDLYTRRTDDGDRILKALTDPDDEDPDDEDPDDGSAAVGAPR
jgi:hypothetical protein